MSQVQLPTLTGKEPKIVIKQQDFFSADWRNILGAHPEQKLLVVGNPPWVTNSALGSLGSKNLPAKTNFQGLRGFDAKTGKANFDIAEWMLIRLLESLTPNSFLAMLCKTMTARKVLSHFWKTRGSLDKASLFLIDAKAHFDVSVDACLFLVSGKHTRQKVATVYPALDTTDKLSEFGFVDGQLASDVKEYTKSKHLAGGSPHVWRSGIKHDAVGIMEFTSANGCYKNGIGESVHLESDYLYPLLKSSHIGNGRVCPSRFVLVTQKKTGSSTDAIRETAPMTWEYLENHAHILGRRKSSIYKNRPKFSIFGVGEYSFALWKVAISGLYKSFRFVVVPPVLDRPVMVDDTCYFVPCSSPDEASLLCELLNSRLCQEFLSSLIFSDSKRPVTTEVLRQISITSIARELGRSSDIDCFVGSRSYSSGETNEQLTLVMER